MNLNEIIIEVSKYGGIFIGGVITVFAFGKKFRDAASTIVNSGKKKHQQAVDAAIRDKDIDKVIENQSNFKNHIEEFTKRIEKLEDKDKYHDQEITDLKKNWRLLLEEILKKI